MSAEPTWFVLKSTNLPDASQTGYMLGRIVKNYEDPEGLFVPRDPSAYVQGDILKRQVLSDAKGSIGHGRSNTLLARLASIFEARGSRDGSGTLDFRCKVIRAARLEESYDNVFDALMEDEEVVKKLKIWLTRGGPPAYMIVGVLTWEDASLAMQSGTQTSADMKVAAPFGAAASAVTGVPGLGQVGDVTVQGLQEASISVALAGRNEGERIFAVEYKAVFRKIFSHFGAKILDQAPKFPIGRTFSGDPVEPADENPFLDEVSVNELQWPDDMDSNNSLEMIHGNGFCLAYES